MAFLPGLLDRNYKALKLLPNTVQMMEMEHPAFKLIICSPCPYISRGMRFYI
jgi:hypothetical protein